MNRLGFLILTTLIASAVIQAENVEITPLSEEKLLEKSPAPVEDLKSSESIATAYYGFPYLYNGYYPSYYSYYYPYYRRPFFAHGYRPYLGLKAYLPYGLPLYG